MQNNKPVQNDLSAPDQYGANIANAHVNTLIENPDSVMVGKGSDLSLYDELLRDDQVASTFSQRRNAVISAETTVIAGGDSESDLAAAEFIRSVFVESETLNFDDVCDKMLYGVFYGFAVAEFDFALVDNRWVVRDIFVRDRSRFKFNTNNELVLLNGNNVPLGGRVLPTEKFWVFRSGASHHDNPYGLGLAHSVYWPVFFKRNNIKFWLVFNEKLGMPTPSVKVPQGKIDDPETIKKARKVLHSIQHDSGVIIPDDLIVEFLEAARSGTTDYEPLAERMDKAISKVVVGQTMTTDDGSSRAQAEVHSQVAQEYKERDADLLCNSLNTGVIPYLISLNFPEGTKPPKIWRQVEEPEDTEKLAKTDQAVSELGFEPDESYIQETYGPHWRKRQTRDNSGNPLSPSNFSEGGIAARRADHRSDQEQIFQASVAQAKEEVSELIKNEVDSIVAAFEESNNAEEAIRRLNSLRRAQPDDEQVESIQRLGFIARLLGQFRGQRARSDS